MIQLEFSFSAPEVTPELCRFQITGPIPAILSPEEAADLAGCEVDHIYYLIRVCQIEASKIRWQWRIFGKSLEAYALRRSA